MSTPREDEIGAVSQPDGEGPVVLSDRTEPGGQGSPDTNQGTTEPMSPTPDHPEPAADVPTLAEMNVGSADPQSPSHPAALAPTVGGAAPRGTGGAGPAGEGANRDGSGGAAQRAPGSLGQAPAGEAFGVDLEAGAERMAPTAGPGDRVGSGAGLVSGLGDPGPSPSAGDGPLEGSSEQQDVVTGTRLPQAP